MLRKSLNNSAARWIPAQLYTFYMFIKSKGNSYRRLEEPYIYLLFLIVRFEWGVGPGGKFWGNSFSVVDC